jgi:hypothetical protein
LADAHPTGPHHVVVDGSNLATEGRTLPSLAQLDEAVRAYAQEDPEGQITVVVDASFEHRVDEAERATLRDAMLNGEIVSPPAGAIGRGDAFVLRIAERTGAVVVSNDSFQEFHGEHPWLFDDGRLIGGKPVPGVGWIFTPRLPIRGPKSRASTAGARAGRDPESAPAKAAELARAARKAAKRTSGTAAPAVSWPLVPSVPPPRTTRGRAKVDPALSSAISDAVAEAIDPPVAEGAEGSVPARVTKKAAEKAAKAAKATKKATAATKKAADKTAKAAMAVTAVKKSTGASKKAADKAAKAAKVSKATKVTKKAADKAANGAKATKKATAAIKAADQPAKVSKATKTTTKAAEKAAKAAKATKKATAATKPTAVKTTAGAVATATTGATRARPVTRAAATAKAKAAAPRREPADVTPRSRRDRSGRRQRATAPPPAVNEPLAFITFVATYPVGSTVDGEVVSFTSHGAMVDVALPDGGSLHCYIPLSAMGNPPPTKARQVLAKGSVRPFLLASLDPPRRVAELALPSADVAKRSARKRPSASS